MAERLVLLVLLAGTAGAQEAAEKDTHVLLATALRRLETAEHVCATVDVKHAPPEQEGGGVGGPGGVVIIETRVVGAEEPFEGRAEAHRSGDGTLVVLSKDELPGFELYAAGDRAIVRTTFEQERFSVEQLKGELGALLDARAFSQRIFDGKLEPKRDEATGEITFRGKVGKDIVPRTGGDMAMFTEGRVLDAHATLVVTPDGRLKSASVKITRSDPAREMLRGGGRIVFGGPGMPAPPADDDERKHDIVGGSTTYTLSFTDAGPSERAKAFRAEAERLVKPADRRDPPPGRPADDGR